MPKGYVDYDGCHFNYNLLLLEDKYGKSEYVQIGNKHSQTSMLPSNYVSNDCIFETEREGINFLKSLIIHRLKGEYQTYDSFANRINKTHKKIWYYK